MNHKIIKYLYRGRILCCLLAMCLLLSGCELIGLSGKEDKIAAGLSCLEEKKYDEAIAAFQEAVEAETDIGEAYRGIGIALWEQEQYSEAKEAFKKALINGSMKTGTIYNFLGICSLKEEDLDSALTYFETGIRCEKEGSVLQQEMEFNVIAIYEKKLEWETAKAKMEAYITKYPDDEKAAKEAEFLRTR
ncbi:MAG TPA: hypothetical protein DCZ20_08075 [Lachnospiraceae bacterium]|nr:hypothetical protein [Lachnospiraceae bacterium]